MKIRSLLAGLVILIFFIALFNAITFSAEPNLSDKEAKAFIENVFTFKFVIKLGYVDVLGGLGSYDKKPNLLKGIINEEVYKYYQAFEKLGIIKITKVKEYAKGNWEDFAAATLGGLKERILIEKTDLGEQLSKRSGPPKNFPNQQKDGWLFIKEGVFRVDKIIRNEAMRKGIDDYRLIMATYTAEWTPEYKRAMELADNKKLSEKRKVRMLIKFDPFSSMWKWVAFDVANSDEEFHTDNVPNSLLEIQFK